MSIQEDETEQAGLLSAPQQSQYGTNERPIKIKIEEEKQTIVQPQSPTPKSHGAVQEPTEMQKTVARGNKWSEEESLFAKRWESKRTYSNRGKGCCQDNTLAHAWQRMVNRSVCDPWVKVTLSPQSYNFQTRPIYGGGSTVGFGEFDDNYFVFPLRQERPNKTPLWLCIEVYDAETATEDRFIGSTEDRTGKSSVRGVLLEDLIEGKEMYMHMPIYRPSDDLSKSQVTRTLSSTHTEANTLTYSGHVQVKLKWEGSNLHCWVYGASNLHTGTVRNPEDDPKFVFFAFVVFMIYILIGALLFREIEGWSFSISFWFFLVTTTTVGYGDYYPLTDEGKILNCFSIFIGLVILGWCFQMTTNYLISATAEAMDSAKQSLQNLHQFSSKKLLISKTVSTGTMADSLLESSGEKLDPKIAHDPDKLLKWSLNRLKKDFYITLAYEFVFVGLMILAGTLFFGLSEDEDKSWVDSFQWCFVTMSTVGYGDTTPTTPSGRVFAAFFMIFGIALLARLGSLIIEYQMHKRQTKNEFTVLTKSLVEVEQITEFDTDESGQVDKFEYISKLLVLTGYVEQEVIDRFVQQFEEIDSDDDKKISVDDIRETLEHRIGKQIEAVQKAEEETSINGQNSPNKGTTVTTPLLAK